MSNLVNVEILIIIIAYLGCTIVRTMFWIQTGVCAPSLIAVGDISFFVYFVKICNYLELMPAEKRYIFAAMKISTLKSI